MDRTSAELIGYLREPVSRRHWVSVRQHKIWRPPTDVYETDDCIVVKVEVAGMNKEDFDIALDAQRLAISGVRHDPASKLGYQQMEILYGHFQTEVRLPRAIDEEKIAAVYEDGFLSIRLHKAKPHRVPVITVEEGTSEGTD